MKSGGTSILLKPPIFVWEPNDLSAFSSISAAEKYLEPIDVKNGIYQAYDSEGRKLILTVESREEKFLGIFKFHTEHVVLKEGDANPSHKAELHRIFCEFLKALGKSEDFVSRLSFEELHREASDQAVER